MDQTVSSSDILKAPLGAGWVDRLTSARRIVIKVGTRIVTGPGGTARDLTPLVESITRLIEQGRQVTLVSSGAVGLGANLLRLAETRTHDLAMRQACAAVGQGRLMRLYAELFSQYGITVAQVLLTEDDFRHRIRYLNLRRTFEKLLKLGVIPIVNENDTVSTAELEYRDQATQRVFSDNDRLAALVMSKIEADVLLLLTNVDGLLTKATAPAFNPEVISVVTELTPEIRGLASKTPSAGGRGGMSTKLEAAEIAMKAGGVAVIANGSVSRIIDRVFAGEQVGTVFFPHHVSTTRMNGRRRWLAYAADVRGRIIVNEGAQKAILCGKGSLLTSGVIRVERSFEQSEIVSIGDSAGKEFARGIANLSSREAEALIKGGHHPASVLVTRNNILILQSE